MEIEIEPLEREIVALMCDERKRQGLSASALARKIGLSRGTVEHVEKGGARPTLWVSLSIAAGLGRSLASFVDEAEARRRRGAV